MSEEKPKRKRSHELRGYAVKLTNGKTVLVQSDDLRNARRRAIETYGEKFVEDVKHAKGSRRNPAWEDKTSSERSLSFTNKRRAALNKIAVDNGWKSWYEYETFVLKDIVSISPGS